MSLHKLTAGDGYTYLTRQVAAHDAPRAGRSGLAEYYSERGESPGEWYGHGLTGLGGGFAGAGTEVTEAQMRALFGEGLHPDATAIEAALAGAGASVGELAAASRLGARFKQLDGATPWRTAAAERFATFNREAGLPADWPVPAEDRARIRSALGRDMFTAQFGRAPADARELSGFIARASRQATTAVAGYDLTFTPVKSVSVLWALGDERISGLIEQAHSDAVRDALSWVEQHALLTRSGRNGVQQLDVTGMLAATFTHRDARSGDPNLHGQQQGADVGWAVAGRRWTGAAQARGGGVGAVQHEAAGAADAAGRAAVRGPY